MKISVVIPAYNADQYIAKAIESCLKQSFPPHEIIVVDDASTDSTVAVAESFAPRARVLRQTENMGVAVARNRGVEESSGDWIAFLDADDWFLPEKLEMQRRCAEENGKAVLIYTGFHIIATDGSESEARFVPSRQLWPMLRYRDPLLLSSVVLRREAFDAVRGFDPALRNAQDWDLWLRLAVRYSVELFAAVAEPLVVYRRVAGSLSSSAIRYFQRRISILNGSSLEGTSGLSRIIWRQRIFAFNHYDTAIALREEGSLLDLPFMLKSIALWPFPWDEMPMRRYKIAVVMMKQHLFRRLFR